MPWCPDAMMPWCQGGMLGLQDGGQHLTMSPDLHIFGGARHQPLGAPETNTCAVMMLGLQAGVTENVTWSADIWGARQLAQHTRAATMQLLRLGCKQPGVCLEVNFCCRSHYKLFNAIDTVIHPPKRMFLVCSCHIRLISILNWRNNVKGDIWGKGSKMLAMVNGHGHVY